MKIVINGETVEIPSSDGAGGNVPVGTVISYMGLSAPAGYLICDGAQYSISQYPALASFFQTQFGAKNHFGGDGTTTFAVPDMRNLFLRGYHGGAEEQLSGEIGVKQEATTHPTIFSGESGIWGFYPFTVTNKDKELGSPIGLVKGTSNSGTATAERPSYTARPVNMAVLYCIKAVESSGGGSAWEVYSTEETRIGTWIDGKPIYRKVFSGTSGANETSTQFGTVENLSEVVHMYGKIHHTYINGYVSIPESNAELQQIGYVLYIYIGNIALSNQPFTVIAEYTKTTD